MRFAAISVKGQTADVKNNMIKVRKCVEDAVHKNAEFIVLPEFFNTGFALCSEMKDAIVQAADTKEILKSWSRELNVIISGSYLNYVEKDNEVYNTFVIVLPDGTVYQHSKDIPTAIEALYYTYGDSIRVFNTPVGNIGVAMCWEQIRYKTIHEMIGKVDYVVAGSCWWNFCEEDGKNIYNHFSKENERMAKEATNVMARLLGVPVIHASHEGGYEGVPMGKQKGKCIRQIVGNTEIVDSNGNTISCYKSSQDEQYIIADIDTCNGNISCKSSSRKYWTIKIPLKFRILFWYSTYKCHKVYKKRHDKELNI